MDLGLEPIDPFTDDVFAGLDDHPSGLWHPTLSPAPPAAATHHQDVHQESNSGNSTSSSSHEGLALPYDDMLPAQELLVDIMTHLDWQHQLAEHKEQGQQQLHCHNHHQSLMHLDADVLQHHLSADLCTAQGSEQRSAVAAAAAGLAVSAATATETQLTGSMDSTDGVKNIGIIVAAPKVVGRMAGPNHLEAGMVPHRIAPSSDSSHLQCSQEELRSLHWQSSAATASVHRAADIDRSAYLPGNSFSAATTDSAALQCSSSSGGLHCTVQQLHSVGQPAVAPSSPPVAAAAVATGGSAPLLQEPAAGDGSSPSSNSSVPDIDDVSEEQVLMLLSSKHHTCSTEQQQQQQAEQQPRQEQQQCAVPAAAAQLLWLSQHEQPQPQDAGEAAHQLLSGSPQLGCSGLHMMNDVPAASAAAVLVAGNQWPGVAAAADSKAHTEACNSAACTAVRAAAADAECGGLSIAAGEVGNPASPNTSWHSCMTAASHSSALSALSAHAGHAAQSMFGAGSYTASARSGVGLARLLPCQQQAGSMQAALHPSGSTSTLESALDPLGGGTRSQQQRQQQQQEEISMVSAAVQDDDLWQDVFPPSLGSSPATDDGFAALAAHTAAIAAAQAAARGAAAATTEITGISSSPATAGGFTAVHAHHRAGVQASATDTVPADVNGLACSPATAAGFTSIHKAHAVELQPAAPQIASGEVQSTSPTTAAEFTAVDAHSVAAAHPEGDCLSTSPATVAGFTTVDAQVGAAAAAEAYEAVAAAVAAPAEAAGLSPATAGGCTAIEASHAAATAQDDAAAQTATDAAGTGEEHDNFDEGHGVYYAASASGTQAQRFSPRSSASGSHNPYQLCTAAGQVMGVLPFVLYHGHAQGQASAAASTYVLRQSEMVDLSLSTSVHPAQLLQQQIRPGWLTAHQNLPPAAAQAVERAVVALNDSYFYHGRPEQGLGGSNAGAGSPQLSVVAGHAASAAASSGGTGAAAAAASTGAGLGASGVIGMAIRHAGMRQQWSRTQTQPQQDQQARHRLPSQHATSGAGRFSGWHGPTVLGQWFSSNLQQPLAAATGRVAAEVGQRLGGASGLPRNNGTTAHRGSSSGSSGRGAGNRSAGAAAGVAAVPGVSVGGSGCNSTTGVWDVGWGPDSFEDAVLVEHSPDMPQSLQEQEDEAFRGLLFLGGRDSHGRPVVIVNTDAIPAGHNPAPRDAALAYIMKKLTPVVTKGPYVLVMVAFQHGRQFRLLPGVWCVRAYHTLPRAFHKNVKRVILLQPSLMVRAGLALLYPFVSSKAHAKIKQVQRLLDIETATCGEVQVPHLGEPFLTALQHLSRPATAPAAASYGSSAHGMGGGRTVPVPGAMQH